MDSVQVRYETARLLLRILLPLDVARGIGFRSEANLGKDEIVKAVVDENMEIPLTVGNTSKQLRLCLPNIILETFFVYGPVDRVLAIKPATVTLSIEEAQSIKKCLEGMLGNCYVSLLRLSFTSRPDNRAIVGQDISFTSLLDAVKTSRSHVQFLSHLEGLYWFLASLNVVGRDDLQTVVEVLKKYR